MSDKRAILFLAFLATALVITLLVVDIVKSGTSVVTQDAVSADSARTVEADALHPRIERFDPNSVDSLTLVRCGIAPWKVKNFLHYRNAGKRFRSLESMLDTYGWDDSDLEKVRPHVVIADKSEQGNRSNADGKNFARRTEYEERRERKDVTADSAYQRRYAPAKFKALTKVNPNTADTVLLCSIPGIGHVISNAIVRYRNKLGGFASVSQLSEIEYVSPELLEWFELPESVEVRRININKDSFQKMSSHPYIGYDRTRDILRYRRLYGEIKDARQLVATGIFTEGQVERLMPYLEF